MESIFDLGDEKEYKDPLFTESLSSSILSFESVNNMNKKPKSTKSKDKEGEFQKKDVIVKEMSKEEEEERRNHPEHFIELCDSFGFPLKMLNPLEKKENYFDKEKMLKTKRKRNDNINTNTNTNDDIQLQNFEDKIIDEFMDNKEPIAKNNLNDISSSSSSSELSDLDNNNNISKIDTLSNALGLSKNKEQEKEFFLSNVVDINKSNIHYGNSSPDDNRKEKIEFDRKSESNENKQSNDDYIDFFENNDEEDPLFTTDFNLFKSQKLSSISEQPDKYNNIESNVNINNEYSQEDNKPNIESKQSKEIKWIKIDLQKEKSKLNKFLYFQIPEIENNLQKLYENSSSFIANKQKFNVDTMYTSLESQSINQSKYGFFYFMVLCNQILEYSKKSDGNLKISKDIWDQKELSSLFDTIKKSNENKMIEDNSQVRTKEDIKQKIKEDNQSSKLIKVFEKYEREKNITLLKNYINDDIIQNILNHKYERAKGTRYDFIKTKYYNIYGMFNMEKKMFELKVEYLLP